MKTVLLFRSSFCRSNLLEHEGVFLYRDPDTVERGAVCVFKRYTGISPKQWAKVEKAK